MVSLAMFFAELCVCLFVPYVSMGTSADCALGSGICAEQDEYATNMLQIGLSHKQSVDNKDASNHARQENDRQKKSNPGLPCCTIYPDGKTAVPVPRTMRDFFPRESVKVMSLAGTRVKVNGTHVFIPIRETIKGKFYRSTYVSGMREYGVIYQRWSQNTYSSFPEIEIGCGEKTLVKHHEGSWPTTSFDRNMKDKEERSPMTDTIAKGMNKLRITLGIMHLTKSKMSEQLTAMAWDLDHLRDLKKFTSEGKPESLAFMKNRENQLLQNLSRQQSFAAAHADGHGLGCLHYQRGPDVHGDATGVHIPLDKLLVAIEGSMVPSPLEQLNLGMGASMLSYDKATQELTIYTSSSTLFELNDPEHPDVSTAAFYRSHFDGQSRFDDSNPPRDYRIQRQGPEETAFQLFQLYAAIPKDYTYLYQDAESLCPQWKFAMLDKEAAKMDLMLIRNGQSKKMELLNLVRHMVDVLDCSLGFLRGPVKNSNAAAFVELAGYGHMMMELPLNDRLTNAVAWKDLATS